MDFYANDEALCRRSATRPPRAADDSTAQSRTPSGCGSCRPLPGFKQAVRSHDRPDCDAFRRYGRPRPLRAARDRSFTGIAVMPDPVRLLRTLKQAIQAFRSAPGRRGRRIRIENTEEVMVVG